MTFKKLQKLIKQYNIKEDVKLMSDSGWEVDETEMDGVYYNQRLNIIIFTQSFEPTSVYDYNKDKDWIKLIERRCKE